MLFLFKKRINARIYDDQYKNFKAMMQLYTSMTHLPCPLLIQLCQMLSIKYLILYVSDFDINLDDLHENRIHLGY